MGRSAGREPGSFPLKAASLPVRADARATQGIAAAFEAAWSADPARRSVHRYRLAGHRVALRIAGRGLARRVPRPLSHLASDDAPADPAELRIDLWDGLETGVPCPIGNLRDAFYRTWPFGRHVLASTRDETTIGYQTFQALTLLDRAASRIVGYVAGSERLSLYELGKPLQPLLFAWLSDRQVVPVHAGLVSRNGVGILLGGAGGSGKTTTSLLCARAGFDYLGDDYIALPAAEDGAYRAYGLYSSTWLDPDHARRFPWLVGRLMRGGTEEDKWLVVLADVEGIGLAAETKVGALALPRVTGAEETTWAPASRAEALRRLAPSSILQLPFISPGPALARMAELAQAVPVYRLELGTDLDRIPRRVAELLDGPATG